MNDQRARIRLFDDWAEHYDHSIPDDQAFPFHGYQAVLDEITPAAAVQAGMMILDLGLGRGNLAPPGRATRRQTDRSRRRTADSVRVPVKRQTVYW